jgi:hypothetical protein
LIDAIIIGKGKGKGGSKKWNGQVKNGTEGKKRFVSIRQRGE